MPAAEPGRNRGVIGTQAHRDEVLDGDHGGRRMPHAGAHHLAREVVEVVPGGGPPGEVEVRVQEVGRAGPGRLRP